MSIDEKEQRVAVVIRASGDENEGNLKIGDLLVCNNVQQETPGSQLA